MINCTITSPQKTVIYKKAESVTLPALSGEMQVLPGHIESFIILKQGNIIFKQNNKKDTTVQIQKGQCYVKRDEMLIVL